MEKSRKVSVIDYGMGNLMSVLRAWQHVGADASIISSPSEISPDAVLVFPGQGAIADTLLVALRQVADETSVDVVDLRQAADLADVLLAVELDTLQLIHEVEVLFDRHIHVKRRQLRQVADELFHFVRVFQGIFALYRDRTARGGKVPGNDIHGCGFTCTVRPEEADDGALFNREADIVQRGICTVALREVFDLDHV